MPIEPAENVLPKRKLQGRGRRTGMVRFYGPEGEMWRPYPVAQEFLRSRSGKFTRDPKVAAAKSEGRRPKPGPKPRVRPPASE